MADHVSRRTAMKSVGVGGLALALGGIPGLSGQVQAAAAESPPDHYELPELPYDYNALEPVIEERILRIHHDRHHAGYVKGLNSTLDKLAEARRSGNLSHVKALSRALAYHGSGHVLHTLYWESMAPGGSREPGGALRRALDRDFGSLSAFQQHFLAATKGVEASGWGLLALEPMHRRLLVLQIEKHQNLTMWGVVPLMVCDVWEHAYYLQYQNNRGDYVDKFWKTIDWPAVGGRYRRAL